MATYRQILNRVLNRLGVDEVDVSATVLTDTYHKLIGQMLNDVKEEIEAATNWRVLLTSYNVSLAQPNSTQVITGATERSRLARLSQAENGELKPLVFDVTDASNPIQMYEMDLGEVLFRLSTETSGTAQPGHFALDSNTDGTQSLIVYPFPTTNRQYVVYMYTPQPRLEANALDEPILIPERPLYVGTVWHALEERGEELGPNSLFSEAKYALALADAVSLDNGESGDIYEMVPV